MAKNLPAIEYAENSDIDKSIQPFIDARDSLYTIPFYKDVEYFSNLDSYQKFIKGVENQVRNSDRYSKYKAYLIGLGLDHCQVLKNLKAEEDCTVEMHHGPIYTLYDICCIVTEYFLLKDWKLTTFRVADQVLKEHEENNIQVVMLSASVHEQVGDRNIFIHPSQAFGNLGAFIKKYGKVISPDLRDKYNRYLDRALITDSTAFGNLDLNKKLWSTGTIIELPN